MQFHFLWIMSQASRSSVGSRVPVATPPSSEDGSPFCGGKRRWRGRSLPGSTGATPRAIEFRAACPRPALISTVVSSKSGSHHAARARVTVSPSTAPISCVTCLWRTDGQSFILRTRGRGASKRPVLRWHLRPVTRRGEQQMTARFRCSTFRGCARASWLRHRFPSSRSVPH